MVVLLGKEKKERESDPEFGAQQANVVLSTSLRVLCNVCMYVLMAKSKRGGVMYLTVFVLHAVSLLFIH